MCACGSVFIPTNSVSEFRIFREWERHWEVRTEWGALFIESSPGGENAQGGGSPEGGGGPSVWRGPSVWGEPQHVEGVPASSLTTAGELLSLCKRSLCLDALGIATLIFQVSAEMSHLHRAFPGGMCCVDCVLCTHTYVCVYMCVCACLCILV